ncbi:MAG: response regulator [Endomicrobium sp.]|jgi:CheY-like chemotaxis protein/signal transduction histidine kinase/HPt (histidine-containing phosphotransfer) domain-containing protein/PAS domain-containing protein|nr:response regulator [Endomicrobium sp.]
MGIKMGIKSKILAPGIVVILLVAVAILISNIFLFSGFVDDSTIDRINSAAKVASNSLYSLKAEARAVSLSISKDSEIISAVSGNNRDKLLARANVLQNETGIDFCTITDKNGTVIARTHDPEKYGDSVVSQANVRSALRAKAMTAVEEGSVVRLSVRSGTPVFNSRGEVAGVVSVGYRLDTDRFVDSIKEMMDCEVTVVLGDERIATTILQEDGTRGVGTRADPKVTETVLSGKDYSGRVNILGRIAVSKYIPVYGPEGKAIGMLFLGQYLDDEIRTIWSFVEGGSVITVVMLVISVVIVLIVLGRIVRPILAMTKAASALAVGDTEIDIRVNTNDEMHTLAEAFNSMIKDIRSQVQIIEHIAAGDLEVSPQARSAKDIMNISLGKLNATIRAQAAALKAEHERIQLMLDATPLASRMWDRNYNIIECNEAAVKMFNLKDKREYIDRYYDLSPQYQPDGQKTRDKSKALVVEAFEKGSSASDWMYQLLDGTPVPSEVTLVRIPYGGDYVVAAYSRDLREQKKMISEIEQRDNMLQTVNKAAEILLRSETGDFEKILHRCMEMMTRVINADRMYIFKNFTENGKLFCTQMYEWSGGVQSFQNTDFTTNISYDEKTPVIKDAFLRGDSVHMLVRDMPPAEREWFSAQGILTVLIVPVFIQNEFWGVVGFDNCRSEKLFAEREVSVMRSGSLLVANALLRNEDTLRIKETSAKLETALDDARDANNAKSSFLAHMSHEIRTPLNAVVGLSELALDYASLDAETEDKLEKIHGSGMTILSIVNDILDISKIESGKFEIYPIQYDTPSLINDIVTLNIVRIGEKPITFKLYADENLPVELFGDDLRIKQIFNNLLSNAFKYTNSGTVEWRMEFERDGGDVWLVSSIQDTGIGIKPEGVKKLFSDYNQVDVKTNRKVEGTGLGLAITKNLVEMMGGTITVESEYGKGTTFRVRIRQKLVSDAPIGKAVAENLMGLRYTISRRAKNTKLIRVNMSYARVLVVDDVATNLDVVKGMLKPYKMKVDCALSGPQAIEMIRAENPRYSAVFMDHMMPDMDGIEATHIIREEIGTEYARNVPIIALTANAIHGNEEMFLSRGFQDFISKPIDITKLDAVLRRWVRNKDLEKAEDSNPPSDGNCAAGNVRSLLDGITIKGVDKKKALERFSGDETVFIDVLRSYASGTRPILNDLEKYLETGNFKDYAIAVHGIKASSYAIFAQEAGKMAEELEKAAKAGNSDAVKSGHYDFVKAAVTILDNIDKALAGINLSADKPSAAAPDPVLLQELRDACKAFDMDKVDSVMARLESFRYENGEKLVECLRRHVGNMDFEKISEWSIPEVTGLSCNNETSAAKEDFDFTAPDAQILIVDDNETNLKIASGLLKPLGIHVDTAGNGEQALRMIRGRHYDVIFMDQMMPVMDGIEAVGKLRNMEEEYYKKVPVIALTASNEPGDREIFLQAGMNDFMMKPVEKKEIAAKIRQWLPAGLLREKSLPDHDKREQSSAPAEGQTDDLPVIDGIDSREGIRYAGTKEFYISLLGYFYGQIDSKAEKIEKCLADRLLRDVTIEVHSLKGTAKMIGAKELSEGFSRLERYGHDNNIEALERETPDVLKQYRSLKDSLKPFVGSGEPEKK